MPTTAPTLAVRRTNPSRKRPTDVVCRLPRVPTSSVSARRTTHARKPHASQDEESSVEDWTLPETGTVCKRSLGNFSRSGLRQNSFDVGVETGQSSMGDGLHQCPGNRGRPKSARTVKRWSASFQIRRAQQRRKKKKKKKPALTTMRANEKWQGGCSERALLLLRRRCNDAQGRPCSHPRYALVKTAARDEEQKSGVGRRRSTQMCCVLSPLIARVE